MEKGKHRRYFNLFGPHEKITKKVYKVTVQTRNVGCRVNGDRYESPWREINEYEEVVEENA